MAMIIRRGKVIRLLQDRALSIGAHQCRLQVETAPRRTLALVARNFQPKPVPEYDCILCLRANLMPLIYFMVCKAQVAGIMLGGEISYLMLRLIYR